MKRKPSPSGGNLGKKENGVLSHKATEPPAGNQISASVLSHIVDNSHAKELHKRVSKVEAALQVATFDLALKGTHEAEVERLVAVENGKAPSGTRTALAFHASSKPIIPKDDERLFHLMVGREFLCRIAEFLDRETARRSLAHFDAVLIQPQQWREKHDPISLMHELADGPAPQKTVLLQILKKVCAPTTATFMKGVVSAVLATYLTQIASKRIFKSLTQFPGIVLDKPATKALVQLAAGQAPQVVGFEKRRGRNKCWDMTVAIVTVQDGVKPRALGGSPATVYRRIPSLIRNNLCYDRGDGVWRSRFKQVELDSLSEWGFIDS